MFASPLVGPTRDLAEFVAGLSFKTLPDAVVRQACDVVLDTVGCALGAWRDDAEKAAIARNLATSFASGPIASIWGGGGARADAALAALANGILANAADFDDTHKRALLHTGSTVVPPALALAEERQLDGATAIAALVAGYEVAVRVGMAVMPTHYRFWHSTATALYPDKFPARVTVTLKSGQKLQGTRYFPKGDPQDPLSPTEIEGKFLVNASARHGDKQAAELIRLIRDLPEAKNLSRLSALLAA